MSLIKRVISGSLRQLLIQIFNRLIGLISTLILARLLVPADFGLVAIVMIAIQFFETLSDTGIHNYVIQKEHIDSEDLNTAFTLEVLLKLTITLLLIPGAWLISQWYETPAVYPALLVASLTMLIRAFKNPGYSVLIKNINYQAIFRLSLAQKCVGFMLTIGWALLAPSFWALLIGDLFAALLFTVGTYRIHAHRPLLTLSRLNEQWLFSQWSLLRGIVGFVRSQLDTLIVSRMVPTTQLGAYHMQRDLAVMPALLIVLPTIEPLLAALANGKSNTSVYGFRFRVSFLFLFAALLPLTAILWNFSEGITLLALGSQWLEYHELIKYFSLLFITYCLFGLVADSFVALGKIQPLFFYDLFSTLLLSGILITLTNISIIDFALYRGVLGVLVTVGIILYLNHQTPLQLRRLTMILAPAALACACTQIVITYTITDNFSPIIKAIWGSFIYICIYCLFAAAGYLALWFFKDFRDEINSVIRFARLMLIRTKENNDHAHTAE